MNYIVSVDRNWGIGKNNDLLFSIPTDMKFFRETTLGKTVVMGRKTLLSLPNGKPLKNRENIIMTRDRNFSVCGAEVVHSVDELFELIKNKDSDDIFVMGGAEIYNLLYKYCKFAYITKVDADAYADVFIENLDCLNNWSIVKESETIFENQLEYRFLTYENSKVKSY